MEESIGTFLGTLCALAPCLLFIGAIFGGIAFVIKRRKKATLSSAAPVTASASPSQSVAAPTSTTVQPSESILEHSSGVAVPLMPSEVVALKGDLFAPSAGVLNSWKLVGSEMKVSGPTLAQNMLAAAFLAVEKTGDICLEQAKKKATFGLREVDTLRVVPNGQSTNWPAGSFEAKIARSARALQASGRNTVKDLIIDALEQDSGIVWDWALRLAHSALAKRGVLNAEVKKGLLSNGLAQYSLSPATSAALTQAKPAEIQQLLQSCAKDRPELFKLLNKEIKAGFDARKEASDSGSDSGPDMDF